MTLSKNHLKLLRSLGQKKYRDQQGCYLAEGIRSVRELLNVPRQVREIFLREPLQSETRILENEAREQGLEVYSLDSRTYSQITHTTHPSGVAALCNIVPGTPKAAGNWLYLDRVSDPGNAGTILRTAAWFGWENIAFSPGAVDVYNPKVIRSAMGAQAYCNLVSNISWRDLPPATILAADMSGTPLEAFSPPPAPWILALGSEAHGLSGAMKQDAKLVSIPCRGRGESLNVGVAAGILLEALSKV